MNKNTSNRDKFVEKRYRLVPYPMKTQICDNIFDAERYIICTRRNNHDTNGYKIVSTLYCLEPARYKNVKSDHTNAVSRYIKVPQ
jgi:hypothetical protein